MIDRHPLEPLGNVQRAVRAIGCAAKIVNAMVDFAEHEQDPVTRAVEGSVAKLSGNVGP